MLKRVLSLAAVVVLSGHVFGADVAATGPAKGDFSEPKKAVGSFLSAVQAADQKGIEDAIVVAPEQAAAVGTYVKLIVATNKLEKAAEGKFGEQAEQYFGVNGKQMEARLKAVQGAEVKMVGDSALIEIPADEATHQPGGTLLVKKVGNDWKLDAGTLFKLTGTPKEQTDRGIQLATKMIPLTEQMTQEIEGGKFASAGEAFQAFWGRSLETAKGVQGGAGTQPAGK